MRRGFFVISNSTPNLPAHLPIQQYRLVEVSHFASLEYTSGFGLSLDYPFQYKEVLNFGFPATNCGGLLTSDNFRKQAEHTLLGRIDDVKLRRLFVIVDLLRSYCVERVAFYEALHTKRLQCKSCNANTNGSYRQSKQVLAHERAWHLLTTSHQIQLLLFVMVTTATVSPKNP